MSRSRAKPAPVPQLPSRAEQATQRRDQLVRVANLLIEEGGVDAVTFAAVTLRAGCARTLVYKYFDSREDLLAAVIDDFFERLDQQLSERTQRRVVAAMATGGLDEATARAHIELVWDALVAGGLGGAILWTTPLLSERLRDVVAAARSRYDRRMLEPLLETGLSEAEARTAIDASTANFVSLVLRAQRGEITREEGIELHRRVERGVIQGLMSPKTD